MKFGKYFVLIVAIVSVFSFCAFSSSGDFQINAGDGYFSCYKNGSKNKVVDRLNEISKSDNKYTVKKFESMLSKNSIEFFAVNKYDSSQIRVSVYSDEISEKIQDMSIRTDKEIKEYAENLVADTDLTYKLYSKNSKKYIEISKTEKDGGGEYISSQFITICNGDIYNISFYNDGTKLKKESYDILSSFEINDSNAGPKMPVFTFVIIALAIAALITVIVIMVLGIIKDKKKKE